MVSRSRYYGRENSRFSSRQERRDRTPSPVKKKGKAAPRTNQHKEDKDDQHRKHSSHSRGRNPPTNKRNPVSTRREDHEDNTRKRDPQNDRRYRQNKEMVQASNETKSKKTISSSPSQRGSRMEIDGRDDNRKPCKRSEEVSRKTATREGVATTTIKLKKLRNPKGRRWFRNRGWRMKGKDRDHSPSKVGPDPLSTQTSMKRNKVKNSLDEGSPRLQGVSSSNLKKKSTMEQNSYEESPRLQEMSPHPLENGMSHPEDRKINLHETLNANSNVQESNEGHDPNLMEFLPNLDDLAFFTGVVMENNGVTCKCEGEGNEEYSWHAAQYSMKEEDKDDDDIRVQDGDNESPMQSNAITNVKSDTEWRESSEPFDEIASQRGKEITTSTISQGQSEKIVKTLPSCGNDVDVLKLFSSNFENVLDTIVPG